MEPVSPVEAEDILHDEWVRQVADALYETPADDAMRQKLVSLHAADFANLLEQLDDEDRLKLVDWVWPDLDPEILVHLRLSVRKAILGHLPPASVAALVSELDSDDALNMLQDLDEDLQSEIMLSLSGQFRAQMEQGLTFPEYSAGRLIQREVVALPQFWTVGKTIDFMRATADTLPDQFHEIIIVDPMYRVVGTVRLDGLLRSRRGSHLIDIQTSQCHKILATSDQEEVANLFRRYSLLSAPVVDDAGRLLGVVTVDDIVDVIDEEAEDDLLKLSGVAESDIFSAILGTLRSRVIWLLVNMATAFLASSVIGVFEQSIDKLVALAVLMPIVASMGGNAGTQTLAVAVRALALKELSPANALRVLGKEICVAGLNGLILGTITALLTGMWFHDWGLAAVILVAMMLNMAAAGLAGVLVPLTLQRFRIDPAIASGVFVTCVTDIVGFFSFLGLATLVLLR